MKGYLFVVSVTYEGQDSGCGGDESLDWGISVKKMRIIYFITH